MIAGCRENCGSHVREILASAVILGVAVLGAAWVDSLWLSALLSAMGIFGAIVPLIARSPEDAGPLFASAALMSVADFVIAAWSDADPAALGTPSAGFYIVVLTSWRPGRSAALVLLPTVLLAGARLAAVFIAERM